MVAEKFKQQMRFIESFTSKSNHFLKLGMWTIARNYYSLHYEVNRYFPINLTIKRSLSQAPHVKSRAN